MTKTKEECSKQKEVRNANKESHVTKWNQRTSSTAPTSPSQSQIPSLSSLPCSNISLSPSLLKIKIARREKLRSTYRKSEVEIKATLLSLLHSRRHSNLIELSPFSQTNTEKHRNCHRGDMTAAMSWWWFCQIEVGREGERVLEEGRDSWERTKPLVPRF
jgi:hypothetical protein